MARSAKLKPILFIFAGVLALGLLTYAPWQPAPDDIIQDVLQPGSELASEDVLEQQSGEAIGNQRRTTVLGGRQRANSGTPVQRERVVAGTTIPHDIAMDKYKDDLWTEILANPPEFPQPGDPPIDADMAYRLYMYFGNCSMAPRTDNQVDRRLDNIVNRTERANERALEGLEGRANQILDYYELCLPIPPDVDRRMEAVIWMSKAVRLGHEIAQVQFYEKAMGFLLRPDRYNNNPPLAMLHPGLVEEFKSTARFGLARALNKGHPEAYMAKSQALLEGLIYPKDPQQAYAYARVAELEAKKNRIIIRNVAQRKNMAAQYLSQQELDEAEQMALELPLNNSG